MKPALRHVNVRSDGVSVIGYKNAAHIAEKAAAEGTALRKGAIASGKIQVDEYDRNIVPEVMICNGLAGA